MRISIGTALGLALLVSACGDSSSSQQNVTSISVRSAEQNALHKLSPMNQKIAMRRALYHGKPQPPPEPRRPTVRHYRIVR